MKFDLVESLIIVSIDGRNYLIDSGSNISFSITNDLDLVINDNNYLLKPCLVSGMVKDALEHLIPGKVIDGVIGTDIIRNNLTVDYKNKELFFDLVDCKYPNEEYYVPFEVRNGYLFIDYYFYDKKLNLIVDSGSKNWFIKHKFLENSQICGSFEDYSPELGYMSGNLYEFYNSLFKTKIEVAQLPSAYNFVTDGIIPTSFADYVKFDFKRKLFSFARAI